MLAQQIKECESARCESFLECKVKWGRQCKALGGTKIPKMIDKAPIRTREKLLVVVADPAGTMRVRRNIGDVRYG